MWRGVYTTLYSVEQRLLHSVIIRVATAKKNFSQPHTTLILSNKKIKFKMDLMNINKNLYFQLRIFKKKISWHPWAGDPSAMNHCYDSGGISRRENHAKLFSPQLSFASGDKILHPLLIKAKLFYINDVFFSLFLT